ncbi:LysR family transcriptional regulator [Romboutsia sp.]|uniref:LysR family transcriptional regulator n=1 Tax=Romboutsia sp. TaxID=1965302 RepID=UPI003F2D5830
MNIKEIEYFIEVVKERNFTKAANNLYISQPALSKAIKNLETNLKTQLIERNAKTFNLTYDGEIFYENAKQSVEIINRELYKLQDTLDHGKKTIKIGIPPVIGSVYFTLIIAEFRKLNPDIEIYIIEEGANNIKEKVENESIELGAVIFPIKSENLISYPIRNNEVMLVVSKEHPLAYKDVIDLSELESEKFIVFNEDFMMYDKIIKACKDVNFTPNIVMKTSQWDFIIEMVALNQGITILPKPIVKRFKSEEVKMIKIVNPNIDWNIGLIIKKDRYMSKSLKIFLQYVTERIKEIGV